jgi:hypothetical protein
VTASKLQPTLLGGLFIGVLSALPVVSMGNCLCCLWVVSGGVLAAYLLQQNQDAPIQAGDAAIVGLLAGIVGAFVAAIVSIPIQMLMGPLLGDWLQQISQAADEAPPEFRELLDRLGAGGVGVVAVLVGLLVNLVFFSVFGLLGGLLGHALFRRTSPPPPPMPSFLEPTR